MDETTETIVSELLRIVQNKSRKWSGTQSY